MKMVNKMIVTIKNYSTDCISLKVFDREKRNSQNFLIAKQILRDRLFADGFADDTDISSVIHMAKKGEQIVSCRVDFIDVDFHNHLTGYRRNFDVPLSVFQDAMHGGICRILVDFDPQEYSPTFHISKTVHAYIREMDKKKRHAFVKSLTTNFRNAKSVNVFKDYKEDFVFHEKTCGYFNMICGGLCLSEDTVMGHRRFTYGKHT